MGKSGPRAAREDEFIRNFDRKYGIVESGGQTVFLGGNGLDFGTCWRGLRILRRRDEDLRMWFTV